MIQTILATLVFLGLPLLAGWLLGRLLLSEAVRGNRLMALALAPGLGLGLSSLLFFAWMVVFGPQQAGFWVVEVLVCGVLAAAARRKGLFRQPVYHKGWRELLSNARSAWQQSGWFEKLLAASLAVALAAFWGNFAITTLTTPNGSFDAYAIWNLRARFFHRLGPDWMTAFSPDISWEFHADYPLLLSLNVTSYWEFVRRETIIFPALQAACFAAGTLALLGVAIGVLRGARRAVTGELMLLAVPFFLDISVWQLADQPLAYYILASLLLIFFYYKTSRSTPGLMALAGAMAAFSAWTKNEGLLFFLCCCLVLGGLSIFPALRPGKNGLMAFASGAVLPLAAVLFFKLRLAPPNDMLSYFDALHGFVSLDRWQLIASLIVKEIIAYGRAYYPVLLLPVLFLMISGFRRFTAVEKQGYLVAVSIWFLLYAGYFAIYLITPHPLKWQVPHSFDRLITHTFPFIVWLAVTCSKD